MRAQRIHRYGPPRDLVLEDVPVPLPGPGHVVIDVEAAGVNYADLLMLAGTYQVRPEPPFSPGFEFAGRIAAVGAGVSGFASGDRVVAMAWHGGYAEAAIAEQGRVYPLPDDVDAVVAASCFVAFGTAHHALVDRGRLRPDDVVLVTGATGGVGTAAVQLAAHRGAYPIAAVGTAEKTQAALAAGARAVVCYDPPGRLGEEVIDLTGGRGVDVVVDVVGGAVGDAAHDSLAWGGTYLTVGYASGTIPTVGADLINERASSLVGVFWGALHDRDRSSVEAASREIFDLVAAGELAMPVAARYSLEDAPAALELVAGRAVTGRAVLIME